MIKKFRQRLQKEGRSLRWWHNKYLNDITYTYFIIQLNDETMLKDDIKKVIEKYLNEV